MNDPTRHMTCNVARQQLGFPRPLVCERCGLGGATNPRAFLCPAMIDYVAYAADLEVASWRPVRAKPTYELMEISIACATAGISLDQTEWLLKQLMWDRGIDRPVT